MLPLLSVQMFCWIFPDSVPHFMATCTADVHHILVVHVGMVHFLPRSVFHDGNTAEQFRRITEYIGAHFSPGNTNQM